MISKPQVLVMPSTKDPSEMRKLLLRLVPLAAGGAPARQPWRNPDKGVLKPGVDPEDQRARRKSSNWTWPSDRIVRVDDTHTPIQIAHFVIDNVDELKHLRPLTVEQRLDCVSLETHETTGALLEIWQSDQPVRLRVYEPAYDDVTFRDLCTKLPLFFLAFPLVIDERLLQPVPRDDSKPLLWLDVDGVVNGSVGSDGQQQIIDCFAGDNGRVAFSPQIVRELNRLSKVCDVYWSTAWHKWARLRLAPAIGLDDFKVWPGWKGTTDAVVNFDRPLIWIDDYLDEKTWDCFSKEMVDAVKAKFKHHLLIGPRLDESSAKAHGLTMRHIEQIDAFLAEHRQDVERADNPNIKRRRVEGDNDDGNDNREIGERNV